MKPPEHEDGGPRKGTAAVEDRAKTKTPDCHSESVNSSEVEQRRAEKVMRTIERSRAHGRDTWSPICIVCCRRLTDEASRAYGIGPECRRLVIRAFGRANVESVAGALPTEVQPCR